MTQPFRFLAMLLISLALCTLWAHPAQAAEVITLYDSDIHVFTDASLKIVESITVNVEGRRIKRGIYRDFPTRYTDASGRRIVVPFDVQSVTMDGHPEKYIVQNHSNGKRVRIGQKDVFVSHGLHTYVITYTTGRQIGFFADHDELYWNVTGNGWAFPIEKVSATVTLPATARIAAVTGYTGPQGSEDANLQEKNLSPNTAFFVSTGRLGRREGMTIVVSWQKGVVRQPSAAAEAAWMFWDNADLYLLFAGAVIVFFYYIFMWRRVGRDPRSGTIVPLFAPPDGISPAAARFIMRMGFDTKCFSAALVHAAVKGCLKIRQNGRKDYTLEKTKEPDDTLSNGEAAVMRALFPSGSKEIRLKQKNYASIGNAKDSLKKSLSKECEKVYFVANLSTLALGVIASILFIGLSLVLGDFRHMPGTLILCVVLCALGVAIMGIVRRFAAFGLFGKIVVGIIVAATALFFAAVMLLVFEENTGDISWLEPVLISFIVLLNVLFYRLLKAPTALGASIRDQLNGFKMFLDIGERERLATLYPPQITPDLFEQFLPYAVALGVEQKWGEKFTAAMHEAGLEPASYVPVWYVGSYWSGASDIGHFASTLSDTLTSTVTSSSTAPGSSSGFSGGSSGGGGGGGGGGGW